MKTSLPLVAAAIVLLLVMARAEGIRLDAESHEAFRNQIAHVSNRDSHAHLGFLMHNVQSFVVQVLTDVHSFRSLGRRQ